MIQEKDYLADLADQPNFGYSLATPLDRLGAALLESLIIYIPLYFILGDSGHLFSENIFDFESILLQSGFAALLGAVFYSLWSGNLGHKLLGMKVISAVDGLDQRKAVAGALREFLKSILGVFIIPIIWLIWDAKNQNLYDKITNTIVVKDIKKN